MRKYNKKIKRIMRESIEEMTKKIVRKNIVTKLGEVWEKVMRENTEREYNKKVQRKSRSRKDKVDRKVVRKNRQMKDKRQKEIKWPENVMMQQFDANFSFLLFEKKKEKEKEFDVWEHKYGHRKLNILKVLK